MPEHATLTTEHFDVKNKDFHLWICIDIFNLFLLHFVSVIRMYRSTYTHNLLMIKRLCISEYLNVTAVCVVFMHNPPIPPAKI